MSHRRRTEALDLVLEVTVSLGQDMEQGLVRVGLTGARAHLLWELLGRGPSTQRALADALRVSSRNVTGLVDGLVASGFVTREPHPTDRRATLVSFTAEGRRTAEGLARGREELADALFRGLPVAQLDCLRDGLGTVNRRLRELRAADAASRS